SLARASTGAGVGKSGSPISMWITFRPAASSARAAVCTSMTWNGAISCTRAAMRRRVSIEWMTYGKVKDAMLIGFVRLKSDAMAALLVWILISLPPGAHAAVFKCAAEGGGAVYQDTA